MPICKFGCDELYEKGYISIQDGMVIKMEKIPTNLSVQNYMNKIIGNQCRYWNKKSKKYFNWHFKSHFKKS